LPGEDEPSGFDDAINSRCRDELQEELPDTNEADRVDVRGAHTGIAFTVLALVLVCASFGPLWSLLIAAAFTAWFFTTFAVISILGERGWGGARRAYLVTFGWGDYITP
jgi:hypothetical protein